MPHKDPVVKKVYDRYYHLNLTPEQKSSKVEYNQQWWKSEKGRYTSQRANAIKRGIDWYFSFTTWQRMWQESGHTTKEGYCMCRRGDVGPYSEENVYITTQTQNKKDAWHNNRITLPGTQLRKADLCARATRLSSIL